MSTKNCYCFLISVTLYISDIIDFKNNNETAINSFIKIILSRVWAN